MFEELQAEEKGEKEERSKMMKITAIIAGVIVVIGVIVYLSSGSHATPNQAAPAHAAAPAAPADPVKDIKIVKAVMGKDTQGVRVMWSVQLRNSSQVYAYHDIKYQAQLIGADGNTISAAEDVMNGSLGPGEEKKFPDFVGGVYDANASTYSFKIVGATAAQQ